jgi:hypothetical protein
MPFVEVCGFAGCGKTRLLEQARKLYRLKEPIWSISLVDAAGADEFAVIARVSEDILGYKIVREQLVEQVRDAVEAKARREERFPSPDQITRAAAAQGAAQLANACRSRQAVLLFDNMERTFVRLLRWLEADLIPALWKEHFAPETKLRLVFAGRYPTCWNEWFVKNRLFQLPLSPFDEVVVSTMLRSSASIAIRTPLTREQNEHIVQRILWLSGGHPRAIRNLLQDLADQKFSVFLGDPDYFQQNRPELFDKHVFPVVKPILRDLSDETRTVLDSLSVFRRFNVGVLKALLDAEHPGAEKPPHEVQGELQQAHLVQPLDVTQPLYSLDHVVRYILAERLEIHEPERHTRLHSLAATLYDNLIAGIGGMPLDSQFLRTYMLESLFHHAILAQLKRETPEQMVFCFRDQVSKVAEKTSDAPAARTVLSQLHMLLEKDKELVCNLDAVIRREGYEEVLQIVDEGITGLAKAP